MHVHIVSAGEAVNSLLAKVDDIADGGALEVDDPRESDGTTLILLKRADAIHAYVNICPHAGRPLNWAPGRFLFSQGNLVCAAHGASFRAADGYCVDGPCRGESLKPVPVEIRDGCVLLCA